MALGDYTPTAWVNDTTPAITATTLGHIETKVNELDDNAVPAQALINIKTVDGTGSGLDADLVDNIHGTAMWYSSSGTGGSDGNAGQPPSAKANRTGGTPPGYFEVTDYTSGSAVTTPNWGGTIRWFVLTYGAIVGGVGQAITAANTGVGNASANCRVFFQRIT